MAYGYFRIITPGLTYSKRASMKADPVALPVDPSNVAAPQEGELLTLDATGTLTRPTQTAGAIDAAFDVPVYFPLLVDKSRTDVQSNANAGGAKLTVLLEKAAMVDTDQYAKSNAGVALVYDTKVDLVPCLWQEDALGTKIRCGYAPVSVGGVPVVPGTPANDGDLIAIGTAVVGNVIRGIHQENGVGVGSRRSVITVLTK